jgi:putative flippase GtrA
MHRIEADYDADEIGNSFFRFCLVGGVGFSADAIVLLSLIYGFGLHPLVSRMLSFIIAVALTFQLNRFWTFSPLRQTHVPSAFAAYVGIQGVGFACNLGIYACALLVFHLLPLLCLALASAVALFVNYIGSKRLVFRKKRRECSFVRPGCKAAPDT